MRIGCLIVNLETLEKKNRKQPKTFELHIATICRDCTTKQNNVKSSVLQCPALIRHIGIECNCLHATWSLPWCPWNASVKIYNFLLGCPLPRRKCLGALALSITEHTGLSVIVYQVEDLLFCSAPTTFFHPPGTSLTFGNITPRLKNLLLVRKRKRERRCS